MNGHLDARSLSSPLLPDGFFFFFLRPSFAAPPPPSPSLTTFDRAVPDAWGVSAPPRSFRLPPAFPAGVPPPDAPTASPRPFASAPDECRPRGAASAKDCFGAKLIAKSFVRPVPCRGEIQTESLISHNGAASPARDVHCGCHLKSAAVCAVSECVLKKEKIKIADAPAPSSEAGRGAPELQAPPPPLPGRRRRRPSASSSSLQHATRRAPSRGRRNPR